MKTTKAKNGIQTSWQRKAFMACNLIFLSLISLICILPLVHILALSFSSSFAASSGKVGIWPVDATLESYKYVLQNTSFWHAFVVTLKRLALAVPLTLFIVFITAYPMAKSSQKFKGREFYTYFMLIPMLFGGGLIPEYMTFMKYGLVNNLWVLVLPGLVPVFSVILLMNFIRDLPAEMEEAASIDGAGPLTSLFRVVLPLATPAIATIALFCIVGHWNSWFDGILYMNHPKNYPLQSFLQKAITAYDAKTITSKDLMTMRLISDQTTRAAQIFVATLPVLIVYPFLQKHFTKGLVMGSVKG
ncbi:carbohydrate ABC transporter permease [Cohnella sp. LGH]|nr:carbohydrate ABC transporter permease [Cohnella sp. LGH]